MERHDLFIDGARRAAASGRCYPSENPATESPWAEVAAGGPEDVELAVHAARRTFEAGTWRDMAPAARGEVLQRVAELIHDHTDELVAGEVADSGATFRKAVTADIPAAADTFYYYAELVGRAPVETEEESDVPVPSVNVVRREAIGVVGSIVPFNFPLAGAAWKIAPALAAGNSVVLKPSPYTPVTALRLAELCHEAGVPAGAINVVAGPGHDVGATLVAHEQVDKVSFTGSTTVGRLVMAACAQAPKPVLLELGGKSPNIVLPDAPIETAAGGILFGTFFHSGQVCQSGTRVLVHRDQHDELMEALIRLAGRIQVGDPTDPMTTMGPVVSSAQLERIERYVAAGVAAGAKVAFGGGRPPGLDVGYYHQPTILTGVTNDMIVAREEIFGPVVCVLTYSSEEEALRIANDTAYGLGAALWTADPARGRELARKIAAGTVWVNDYHLLSPRFPFGGFKRSGFGRELGPQGLKAYQQIKHIHVGQPQTLEEKYYFNLVIGECDE